MSIVSMVVARAENGVIGKDGRLPWYLPDDLRRFKALTMGTAMVMGRKTFESLPSVLPGRRHIVLSRDPQWSALGVEAVHDVASAIGAAEGQPVSVIGGAEIYGLFLPVADRIELTEVHSRPEGDTVLPAFDPAHWQEVTRETHPAQNDRPAFSFVTLSRRR